MKSSISKKKDENLDKWYQEVCLKSELVSRGLIKGQIIMRPFGVKVWKLIQKFLNDKFEQLGCEEIKLPTLIPYSEVAKEKEHFEGFNPELGIITKKGEKIINDPFVIRPTSEIIITKFFSDILISYKNLPIILNQWGSVVRWEKNTKIFLRNNEFWWQEGHTIHESESEAKKICFDVLKIYEQLINNYLLISSFSGEKTKSERFAGAENTWTIETILPDGQALQCATSHFLNKNFSKPFSVKYQTRDNSFANPFQTSWGLSTRILGAIVMLHGDDFGLVLPSKITPYQVVVLTNDKIYMKLKNIITIDKIKYDTREIDNNKKSREWKLKGIPIVLEINEKDFEKKQFFAKIRINNEKKTISFSEVNNILITILKEHDKKLFKNHKNLLNKNVKNITNIDDFNKYLKEGNLLKTSFCMNEKIELIIKKDTSATIRCILNDKVGDRCFYSNNCKPKAVVIFGRSY